MIKAALTRELSLASRLVAGWKIYMCTGFLRAQNSAPPSTPPVLVEKAMGGVRVNIDAHSVPPQPQSIWNRSSLWRTNNLEETLIITHPFILQNLLEASLSPLFLFLHFSVSAPCKVFFYHPLSCNFFSLCTLTFLYVFRVTRDELWINIDDALPEMPCHYTQPSALSGMMRLFTKCFFFF